MVLCKGLIYGNHGIRAMQNDQQLNDFIAAAHERDLKFTDALARISQSQTDMSQRLFGGTNQKGALDYIVTKVEESSKESIRRIDDITSRTGALETWKKTSRSWVAGAVAILTLEGTALGFYFTKIASHVQNLTALHK